MSSPRSRSCPLTLLPAPCPGAFSFVCSVEHQRDWGRQGMVEAQGQARMEAQLGPHGEGVSVEPCSMFLQSRFLFSVVILNPEELIIFPDFTFTPLLSASPYLFVCPSFCAH